MYILQILLCYAHKYHIEAVIVPENGTIKTFPLVDTTFITIFGAYYNPSIAELKSQSNQPIKYAGNKEKYSEKNEYTIL